MFDERAMPVAGRRPPPIDIDPVTEIVDRRPVDRRSVDRPSDGRPRPGDLDPVTELVDPQPTEVVDPQPTEVIDRRADIDLQGTVDPQATEVIDPQATEVVGLHSYDDAQPTEVLAKRHRRPAGRADADPVWRGFADVRAPLPDPAGSSSWSTWIAPRLRRRAWWLPIVIAVLAVGVLVTAAAMLAT